MVVLDRLLDFHYLGAPSVQCASLQRSLAKRFACLRLVGARSVVCRRGIAVPPFGHVHNHELVHLPKEGFRGFRVVWNLLCGIPFMIPSFMYYPHVDHHRRKSYGTEEMANT